MQFEWDEKKRQSILEQRGIDLLETALIFEGVVLTEIDERRDYGEVRKRSVGMVGSTCYVVIYTVRDDAIRLISAWKGSHRERQRYQTRLALRDSADEGDGSAEDAGARTGGGA